MHATLTSEYLCSAAAWRHRYTQATGTWARLNRLKRVVMEPRGGGSEALQKARGLGFVRFGEGAGVDPAVHDMTGMLAPHPDRKESLAGKAGQGEASSGA